MSHRSCRAVVRPQRSLTRSYRHALPGGSRCSPLPLPHSSSHSWLWASRSERSAPSIARSCASDRSSASRDEPSEVLPPRGGT
jgi:hypothetical protein